jgi:4a-hydroxytetrahydrobiopterin dehydratase
MTVKNVALTKKRCVPCEGGSKPLSLTDAKMYHKEVKDWKLSRKVIEREFVFKDFKKAMVFINKVAVIAETEGHHPDIYVFYNKVKLQLSTHAIGGLSLNDFIVAAKVDRVF